MVFSQSKYIYSIVKGFQTSFGHPFFIAKILNFYFWRFKCRDRKGLFGSILALNWLKFN